MKRLSINKTGEVSYGPKWQNTELRNADDFHSPTITTAHEHNKDRVPQGGRFEVSVKNGDMMYVAALQGDWVAAEVLLDRDQNLAFDYLTEEGDRALHVAAAMKHKEFVKKLVDRMSEEELVLLNGHGYTACCYAALSGNVEIGRLIIGSRPRIVTARDEENATPLRKAALQGNGKMLKFLLGYAKNEDLSREEWFDLLVVAIRGEMFGVAIEILGKNGSIATMASEEEGTALHLMARVYASRGMISLSLELARKMLRLEWDDGHGKEFYRREFRELAEKLWGEMQNMEKDSLLELMIKPVHIIHEAAKTGQVNIITMLARSFPTLVWETDCDGYTIFHLAVAYRQRRVFNLVNQVESMLGLRTSWQDRQGNNILHLAASESAAVTEAQLFHPHLQMQRAVLWFEAVKKIVPPSCLKTRNGEGLTPEELFSHTHERLLKESKMWMTNRADSLMLIATIVLTVAFAAAFTVPGGYASQSGEPVLAKKKQFGFFVRCEVVSMLSSLTSIIMFQSIMASSFAPREFLSKLPYLQLMGFASLMISFKGTYLAFMASIMLYNVNTYSLMLWSSFAGFCVYSLAWIVDEFIEMFGDPSDIISYSKDTLFEKKTLELARVEPYRCYDKCT